MAFPHILCKYDGFGFIRCISMRKIVFETEHETLAYKAARCSQFSFEEAETHQRASWPAPPMLRQLSWKLYALRGRGRANKRSSRQVYRTRRVHLCVNQAVQQDTKEVSCPQNRGLGHVSTTGSRNAPAMPTLASSPSVVLCSLCAKLHPPVVQGDRLVPSQRRRPP